jgi:hypothetical protein
MERPGFTPSPGNGARPYRREYLAPHLERRRARRARRSARCVDLLVDRRDLLDPLVALTMTDIKQTIAVPMEMVRDERYLLEDILKGVAHYSPRRPNSLSNFEPHSGQVTDDRLVLVDAVVHLLEEPEVACEQVLDDPGVDLGRAPERDTTLLSRTMIR